MLFPAEQPTLLPLSLLQHCKCMGLHLCLREKSISRARSYLLQGRKAQTCWMCHCKCWKLALTASSLHSHLLTCETSSYSSPGFCTLDPWGWAEEPQPPACRRKRRDLLEQQKNQACGSFSGSTWYRTLL